MSKAKIKISGKTENVVGLVSYLEALGADLSREYKDNVEVGKSVCNIEIEIPESMYEVERSRTRGAGVKKKRIALDTFVKIDETTTLSEFIEWANKNKSSAAFFLDISRPTVYKRIAQAKEIIDNWTGENPPTVKEIGMYNRK